MNALGSSCFSCQASIPACHSKKPEDAVVRWCGAGTQYLQRGGGTLQAGVHCGDPRLVSAARLPPRLWVSPLLLSPPFPTDSSCSQGPQFCLPSPGEFHGVWDANQGLRDGQGQLSPWPVGTQRDSQPQQLGAWRQTPTRPGDRPGNLVQKEVQSQGP